jgi:hypothetical protein
MRRLLATAGVLLAALSAVPCAAQSAAPAPSAATDPDPANLPLAREIVTIAYPPENRRAMFARVSDAMISQVRGAILPETPSSWDAELQQIFERYVERVRAVSNEATSDGAPAIFEAFARAYARQFTRDDLLQIRAFVSTPAGAKYVQRASELLTDPDVAEANRAYMARTFRELEPVMAQLRRETEAYLARRRRR